MVKLPTDRDRAVEFVKLLYTKDQIAQILNLLVIACPHKDTEMTLILKLKDRPDIASCIFMCASMLMVDLITQFKDEEEQC